MNAPICALLLPAVPALPQQAPAPLADLGERWEEARSAAEVAGLAVTVVQGDTVVLIETLGLRDVERELPVTPDTMFYIASATKPYTAMGVLALVEQGRCDLHVPVREILPHFELPDPDLTARLPVRELLNHAQGINSFPIVFLDAYTGDITPERYWRFLRDAQIAGEPRYSNVNMTLAGRVITEITELDWRDWLKESIFDPAGMTRTTGYADTMYADADVAYPSRSTGTGFTACEVRKTDRTMHAAGGLGTTINDLGRWLRLNLGGGAIDGTRVLDADLIAEMQGLQAELGESMSRTFEQQGFGYGWMVGDWHGYRICAHGGGYVGTAAFVAFLPDEGLGVAVLANDGDLGNNLCEIVANDVFARLLLNDASEELLAKFVPNARRQRARERAESAAAVEEAAAPVDEDGLSLPARAYAGRYESEAWGTLEVTVRGGALALRLGDLHPALTSTGMDAFHAFLPRALDADGTFVVEDGNATAVVIDLDDWKPRFDRVSD